jgi:hypothetical protein
MELSISENVNVQLQSIMTGRGCIIGQSGSGKSFLMGIVAEGIGSKRLPFCIIDTEGEYASLKSSIPYVLVVGGESSDISLDVDLQDLFTKSILDSIPIVLDVSEVVKKQDYVYKALSTLYKVEEKLRKPFLVLIEEADKFAPQVVHQNINIIEELSVRGRKRGIGLLIATQRPSNISKNVLSQCSYGFIGKLTIENDLNAISQLFSSRSYLDEIVNLKTGEFMPFGIEFKEKFRVKPRTSFHMGSTPQINEDQLNTTVELNSIINELNNKKVINKSNLSQQESKETKTKSESSKLKNITSKIFSSNISEDSARVFAEKSAHKIFGLFGKKIENVSDISIKYLPVTLCDIRIPTMKKREFEVYQIPLTKDGNLIKISNKITVIKTNLNYKKLTSSEEKLLYLIKLAKSIKKSDLFKNQDFKPSTITPSIRGLISKNLITIKNDKLYSKTFYDFNLKTKLSIETTNIPENKLSDLFLKQNEIELYLKTLFPCSILDNISEVYLPFYEITLKHKNKIRVFKVDSIFGKEILQKSL